jgi:hypothetical protein
MISKSGTKIHPTIRIFQHYIKNDLQFAIRISQSAIPSIIHIVSLDISEFALYIPLR